MLTLAGVPLATDRVLDGVDLSPVLFHNATAAHACIFMYKFPYAAAGAEPDNLAAVRCGAHKAYWYLDSTDMHGLTGGFFSSIVLLFLFLFSLPFFVLGGGMRLNG